jgi:hypothetical protein
MFGTKTPTPTIDEQRAALATVLMDGLSLLAPLFDAADGMRADLLARGWTAEIAEGLAGQWLAAMLTKVSEA